jgi:hypothetical protein
MAADVLATARKFLAYCAAIIAAVVAVASAAEAAEWVRIDTPNFVVYGEASEARVRDVSDQLERFRDALGRVVSQTTVRTAVPTIVIVFGTKEGFLRYRPRYNNKPVELAGFFVSTDDQNLVALTIEDRERGLRTILHEYAHLAIANGGRRLPVWLSEGLAEYYSTFQMESGGRAAVVGLPIREHLQLLSTEPLIRHAELLKVDSESQLYNEGERRSVFYAQSWALVHMLIMGRPDRSKDLARYMALTAAGVATDAAWTRAFGDMDVNAELRKYAARLTMNAHRMTFEGAIRTAPGVATKPRDADVQAALGNLLYHVRLWHEARDTLTRAATQFSPPSALAKALLASYSLDHNDRAEARRLLLEASADTEDWVAQYHVAAGLIRLLNGQNEIEAQPLAAAASHALKAVAAGRPDLPNALALKARLAALTSTGLDEALKDIRTARALVPGREDYAFIEAHVLLQQRNFPSARSVVGPLLSAAYPPDVRERARMLMSDVVRLESAEKEAAERRTLRAGLPVDSAPAPERQGSPPSSIVLRPVYRKLLDGEERSTGTLEAIECSRTGIRLRARVGDRVIRFAAPRFEAVDFISYRDDAMGKIGCGVRTPADPVYVTWRPPVPPATDRIAIAVEFLAKQ